MDRGYVCRLDVCRLGLQLRCVAELDVPVWSWVVLCLSLVLRDSRKRGHQVGECDLATAVANEWDNLNLSRAALKADTHALAQQVWE